MNTLRHCGICGEKNTHKEKCWKCEQIGDRMTRGIQKKLDSKIKEDK